MTNNDILRRLRYLFDLTPSRMTELYLQTGLEVEKNQMNGWLKKEEDPNLIEISDRYLAIFLNGLIIEYRGKTEGPPPQAEDPLTNNMILRKLKIALNLKSDDILELFALANKKISKHELSAFFRKPNHNSYRPCLDQYLRNFLNGLQIKHKNMLGKNIGE